MPRTAQRRPPGVSLTPQSRSRLAASAANVGSRSSHPQHLSREGRYPAISVQVQMLEQPLPWRLLHQLDCNQVNEGRNNFPGRNPINMAGFVAFVSAEAKPGFLRAGSCILQCFSPKGKYCPYYLFDFPMLLSMPVSEGFIFFTPNSVQAFMQHTHSTQTVLCNASYHCVITCKQNILW